VRTNFIKFNAIIFSCMVIISGCKDKQGTNGAEMKSPEIKKYAKYAASVYSDSALSKWAATLAKTEPVDLVKRVTVDIKGKKVEVAEVKLSDGTTGYISSKNIADAPLVFTEETKVYVRNNTSSRIYTTVPKGTIGFTVSERAEWTQVYIGRINGKWVSSQWVNGGYVKDQSTVAEARIYEDAMALLKKADTEKKKEEAMEKLKSLEGSAVFGDLVKGKSEEAEKQEIDMTGKAVVTAKAGLKMRKTSGVDGEEIILIPFNEVVTIGAKGDLEESIAGKTAFWYEVTWKDKTGWVFGGFLDIK